MKEQEILNRRYRSTRCTTVSQLVRELNSELSIETWSAILNRGERPNLRTLLIMCAELSFPPDEISKILIDRGETKIAKLIAPSPVSSLEMGVIEKIRTVGASNFKLINSLIDSLREGAKHGNGA